MAALQDTTLQVRSTGEPVAAPAEPKFRWLITDWKAEPVRSESGPTVLGYRYSFELHACEVAGVGFRAHELRHRVITRAGVAPWVCRDIGEAHGGGETVCRRYDIGLYGTGTACWTGVAEMELATEDDAGAMTRHRFRVRLPFGGWCDAWEGYAGRPQEA